MEAFVSKTNSMSVKRIIWMERRCRAYDARPLPEAQGSVELLLSSAILPEVKKQNKTKGNKKKN